MKLLNYLNKIYISPEKIISFVADINSSEANDTRKNENKINPKVIIDQDGSVRINKNNEQVIEKFNKISQALASCK